MIVTLLDSNLKLLSKRVIAEARDRQLLTIQLAMVPHTCMKEVAEGSRGSAPQ